MGRWNVHLVRHPSWQPWSILGFNWFRHQLLAPTLFFPQLDWSAIFPSIPECPPRWESALHSRGNWFGFPYASQRGRLLGCPDRSRRSATPIYPSFWTINGSPFLRFVLFLRSCRALYESISYNRPESKKMGLGFHRTPSPEPHSLFGNCIFGVGRTLSIFVNGSESQPSPKDFTGNPILGDIASIVLFPNKQSIRSLGSLA